MTTAFFFAGAFLLCLMASNRSLRHGLLALIGVGYAYGILRANFPDTWTYLMFDAAVLGVFVSQLWRPVPFEQRKRIADLRIWMTLMLAWPTLLCVLFILSPNTNPLVELVGLRGNVFLLCFMLLGARLDTDDIYWLALRVGALNVAAVALALVQFVVGIEPFFPMNEVTEIIYKSRDVVGRTAYRIPASFSSAHAFSGTLVMTLPLLLGAWTAGRTRIAHHFLTVALLASLVGVFVAAARLHMITGAVIALVVTMVGQFGRGQRIKWLLVLGLVGYVVAGNARLQRFTTLTDTEFVSTRVAGSVNEGVFDLIGEYPLGNGLAGGGTSVPYFLRQGLAEPIGMENEYARIALEQGIPGIMLWLMFITWVVTRRPWRVRDEWRTARIAAWTAVVVSFGTGAIGTGLLTSIPQTVILMLLTGWVTTTARPSVLARANPRARQAAGSASGLPGQPVGDAPLG